MVPTAPMQIILHSDFSSDLSMKIFITSAMRFFSLSCILWKSSIISIILFACSISASFNDVSCGSSARWKVDSWETEASIVWLFPGGKLTFPPAVDFCECDFKKYECVICGFIYDEALGWPDDGIAPGTKWEDVPEDWMCPDCNISKYDFEMVRE